MQTKPLHTSWQFIKQSTNLNINQIKYDLKIHLITKPLHRKALQKLNVYFTWTSVNIILRHTPITKPAKAWQQKQTSKRSYWSQQQDSRNAIYHIRPKQGSLRLVNDMEKLILRRMLICIERHKANEQELRLHIEVTFTRQIHYFYVYSTNSLFKAAKQALYKIHRLPLSSW